MNKNKEIKNLLESVFSLSDDGYAIINHNGDILNSNINFNKILSLSNNPKENNIYNYIKNFLLKESKNVYTINNMEMDAKIKSIEIEDAVYYIICIKKQSDCDDLKNLYEATVESLTDGIHVIDLNGRVQIYNRAQGKLEGYKAHEVLNKKIETVYELDDETSLLLRVQKEKKPYTDERQIYYTKAGHRIDAVTSVFPLIHNNDLIGSAAIVRDYSDISDIVHRDIEKAQKISKNKNKSTVRNKKTTNSYYKFSDILTKNKTLLEDITWAKLSAKNDSNVLIYGETGTGKELFAQSIHTYSDRKDNAFLAINCAAIPETLLESLLFGTTKGAFTGSVDKAGLFEQTEGGTIYLDEINSMPIMLQAKLLRVLEDKKVMRLGDNKYIPIDVRIISSTNKHPRDAIEDNELRDDLFFRLSVMYLIIPPLRERKEDIDLLCKHFINLYNEEFNKNVKDINEEVRDLFYSYYWSGNIRELKHTIASAMSIVTENNNYISLTDISNHILHNIQKNRLPESDLETNQIEDFSDKEVFQQDNNLFQKIENNEYNMVVKSLIEANGNMAEAARIMGITRQQMHYRVNKYNLK